MRFYGWSFYFISCTLYAKIALALNQVAATYFILFKAICSNGLSIRKQTIFDESLGVKRGRMKIVTWNFDWALRHKNLEENFFKSLVDLP